MEQSQKSRANVYGMVITALFTALTVVCAQISIPIGPVPINLALLAVFAAGGCLGPVKAVISQLVYLLAGLAGRPFLRAFRAARACFWGPRAATSSAMPLRRSSRGCLPCAFTAASGRARWACC